jgi:DNA (cytosine-5)-methyltransferase 1
MDYQKRNKIGIIDIFAGPGGLSEGFASFNCSAYRTKYKILLSIEKDPMSHKTLELRSFYRQFDKKKVPNEYYKYLRGDIKRENLFDKYNNEAITARKEAWLAELGSSECSSNVVDNRIGETLREHKNWLLIGGPPCQAYSLVGRARMKNDKTFKNDPRHYLYKEYLRILAKHAPPVFVMENVKGILSSKGKQNENIFSNIVNDLANPAEAIRNMGIVSEKGTLKYKIYSFSTSNPLNSSLLPSEYVVKSEYYGIPQARHRVILLGIRSDIKTIPGRLKKVKKINTWDVISDLPKIRSECSKKDQITTTWQEVIHTIVSSKWMNELSDNNALYNKMKNRVQSVNGALGIGAEFLVWYYKYPEQKDIIQKSV